MNTLIDAISKLFGENVTKQATMTMKLVKAIKTAIFLSKQLTFKHKVTQRKSLIFPQLKLLCDMV